jgi:hypothetical protein
MENIIMRKKGFQLLILSTMITLLTGCGTVSMYYLNDGVNKFPATSANKVMIFSEHTVPDTSYIEMGYVSVHVINVSSGDALKEATKKEAASIGADAVIDFRISGAGGIAGNYAVFDYRIYGLNAGGIAIKYK